MTRSSSTTGWMFACAACFVSLLTLPVIGLLSGVSQPQMRRALGDASTWHALGLSATTTLLAVLAVIITGTPLAFLLRKSRAPLLRGVETLIQLPVVLPPAVAGVAMLSAFGRLGLLGPVLRDFGIHLAFSRAAVVLAAMFVAGPLYVQGALSAFRAIDETLIDVARTLGAGPNRIFFRIVLPLCRPSLTSAALLCTARASGEFGATLMFAGNLPGTTQTMPLLIYATLEEDFDQARVLSVVMLVVSAVLLGCATIPRKARVT